jgi:hypothetical protein
LAQWEAKHEEVKCLDGDLTEIRDLIAAPLRPSMASSTAATTSLPAQNNGHDHQVDVDNADGLGQASSNKDALLSTRQAPRLSQQLKLLTEQMFKLRESLAVLLASLKEDSDEREQFEGKLGNAQEWLAQAQKVKCCQLEFEQDPLVVLLEHDLAIFPTLSEACETLFLSIFLHDLDSPNNFQH